MLLWFNRSQMAAAASLMGLTAALVFGSDGATLSAVPPGDAATALARPVLRHGVFKFSNYPAAWTAAQSSGRPILIFATAPNCPHCVRMIADSLRSPRVSRLLHESYETVYADRFEQPELAARLGIRRFPTTIIVGPNNQAIDVMEGYVDARSLAMRLQTSVAAQKQAATTR
jgi:thiol-disulfide isomerase/thioredoxin